MAAAARVSAALAVGEHFTARGDDANLAAKKSAAISSWMFEGTVIEEHARLFPDIESEAMAGSAEMIEDPSLSRVQVDYFPPSMASAIFSSA